MGVVRGPLGYICYNKWGYQYVCLCTLQLYEGFFIYERIYFFARYMAVLMGVCGGFGYKKRVKK